MRKRALPGHSLTAALCKFLTIRSHLTEPRASASGFEPFSAPARRPPVPWTCPSGSRCTGRRSVRFGSLGSRSCYPTSNCYESVSYGERDDCHSHSLRAGQSDRRRFPLRQCHVRSDQTGDLCFSAYLSSMFSQPEILTAMPGGISLMTSINGAGIYAL